MVDGGSWSWGVELDYHVSDALIYHPVFAGCCCFLEVHYRTSGTIHRRLTD